MIPAIFIPGHRSALRNYTAAVYSVGGMPICSADGTGSELCVGLLLPGGGDIGKSLDEWEKKLIQSFVQTGRPILGICRGMQALNVFFGGDLLDNVPGHQAPKGDMVHTSMAMGRLAGLVGRFPQVTSNHHQALQRIGDGLQVVQMAPDGIVEAVEHKTLPILGVQWHPERQSFGLRRKGAADAGELFAWFIAQMR